MRTQFQRLKMIMLLVLVNSLISQSISAAEKIDTQTTPVPVLNLPQTGTDSNKINYSALPRITGEHTVINPAAFGPYPRQSDKLTFSSLRLNLHNYLIYHAGKFWCIWSDGPRIEDEPTQEIKYATSTDGLTWSAAKSVTGKPEKPYAFIARGLWVRNGQLLALAAHYRGHGAFGAPKQKQLELVAYRWDPKKSKWVLQGKLYENAINNFPPQKLPSGNWDFDPQRFSVQCQCPDRWLSCA